MRKFFCAREGWALVDADYSQIELRVLAHISGDKNMIKAFKDNEDIHAITASQVFNMPLDMVQRLLTSVLFTESAHFHLQRISVFQIKRQSTTLKAILPITAVLTAI